MKALVCFLDFDGVIATFRAMEARKAWIDPIACEMIARLRAKFDFKIVISSTWRGAELRCRTALTPSGLADHLHDDWRTAPDSFSRRGDEIDDWLSRHGEPDYFILDDEKFDMNDRHHARLIQTDMMDGMLHRHFLAAVTLLSPTPTPVDAG